jgi:hypothetical protein
MVGYSNFMRGTPRSCGCRTGAIISEAKTTHGCAGHGAARRPEYRTWSQIIQRCGNKNNPAYKNYGGRGITVCKRWRKFENFFSDMGPRPSVQHSIDRTDNNKGYTPSNCRWATRKEQTRNTRHCRFLEYGGRRMTLMEWSEKTGIKRGTIARRLDVLGWSVSEALGKTARAA